MSQTVIAQITADITKIMSVQSVSSSLSAFLVDNPATTLPKYHKSCAAMMEQLDSSIESVPYAATKPVSLQWLVTACWKVACSVVDDNWVRLAAHVEALIHTYGASSSPVSGPVVSMNTAQFVLSIRSHYFAHLVFGMVAEKQNRHFLSVDFDGRNETSLSVQLAHYKNRVDTLVNQIRSSAVVSFLTRLERCMMQFLLRLLAEVYARL